MTDQKINTHYKDWERCVKEGGCRFELDFIKETGIPGTPIFSHLRAKDEGKLQ